MVTILVVLISLFVLQGIYRNYGKSTFDAMPIKLGTPEAWNGKDDDDHWYTSWKKQVKGWFAFGPLSEYSWARFRYYPKLLFIITRQPSSVRYENDAKQWDAFQVNEFFDGGYVSRVQYSLDWHIGLQWPLFLHGHYGDWQFYIGFKRDADRIYWLSLYFGKKWK